MKDASLNGCEWYASVVPRVKGTQRQNESDGEEEMNDAIASANS